MSPKTREALWTAAVLCRFLQIHNRLRIPQTLKTEYREFAKAARDFRSTASFWRRRAPGSGDESFWHFVGHAAVGKVTRVVRSERVAFPKEIIERIVMRAREPGTARAFNEHADVGWFGP